jgi:hypothetical protein
MNRFNIEEFVLYGLAISVAILLVATIISPFFPPNCTYTTVVNGNTITCHLANRGSGFSGGGITALSKCDDGHVYDNPTNIRTECK